MTNGEKFREVFSISQVDEGKLYAFAWLPNHDVAEISIDWWNAEYEEPTPKKNLVVEDCISRKAVDDALYELWHDIHIVDDSGLGVYQEKKYNEAKDIAIECLKQKEKIETAIGFINEYIAQNENRAAAAKDALAMLKGALKE